MKRLWTWTLEHFIDKIRHVFLIESPREDLPHPEIPLSDPEGQTAFYHETARRLSALGPALELLGRHYGVDAGDAEALGRAIREDAALVPEKPRAVEARRQEQAKRQVSDWLRQAEELRGRYPSFDLGQEARDPRFRSLIGSGVPLRTAFEVLHQREILPAAMEYSARKAEERLADSVIAGQRRPAEGAMGGQGPVLSKRDVNALSRAERDEIDRRVARGEKIRF